MLSVEEMTKEKVEKLKAERETQVEKLDRFVEHMQSLLVQVETIDADKSP